MIKYYKAQVFDRVGNFNEKITLWYAKYKLRKEIRNDFYRINLEEVKE